MEKGEKLKDFLQNSGLPKDEKSVFFELKDIDEKTKKIELKSGSFESEMPWVGVDERENGYVMMSVDTLKGVLNILRKTQQENFNLKLEKSIWQNIPIDFQDVWAVAMNEVRDMANSGKIESVEELNLDKLVKNIKHKYPNLFLDLSSFYGQPIVR
jgi:hypothetical protein